MVKEKTFSSYDKQQGQAYSEIRRDYHANVYQTILDKHQSTGQLGTVLDVGCGPGLATRTLASKFAHAIGLDPSAGMLEIARSKNLVTAIGEPVQFQLSSAEELGSGLADPIPSGSIDLITAANAAHWFDMPAFWQSAARVLKSGGSVIVWTSGELRAHPSMAGAAEIDTVIDRYEEGMLKPHITAGNKLTKGRYKDLPLPWTDGAHVEGFDPAGFERYEWPLDLKFYSGPDEIDLDTLDKVRSTSSAVQRWREANSSLVDTEQDVLAVMRKDIAKILHAAGVEPGKEKLKGTVHGVILVVKKT